jgi:hypothetical protein
MEVFVDLEVLKKRISTFRGDGGRVKNVSDDVLLEILLAWEQWTGPGRGFATAIGMNRTSLPKLIGKAKKLKREGHFPVEDFKEIKVSSGESITAGGPCQGIEIAWENGKLIRFQAVDQLVEFLKKVA